MYPKEMYHSELGEYRVVWGPEEHRTFKAEGWSDEAEVGRTYRVHTAVRLVAVPATAETVEHLEVAAETLPEVVTGQQVKRGRFRG